VSSAVISFVILFFMKKRNKTAGKLMILENGDAISAETEEIQNRIRERAYELSQMRGHAGREMDDWLSAEADVIVVPPIHMVEKDGSFEVQIAAPGIDLTDVQVMATTSEMLVKCPRRHTHEGEAGKLHICDFKPAMLFRSFRFPEPIDLGSLNLDFVDGMLRITADKVSSATMRSTPRKRTARKTATARAKPGAA
jgi:HSP20 family protein